MNTSTLQSVLFANYGRIVLLILVAGVAACNVTVTRPPEYTASQPSVVVLGGVAKSGLKLPVNFSGLADDLAALLAGRGDLKITPSSSVRATIGGAPHDEMLSYYARHARLAPYQVQRLMAANLSASSALAVRLESDDVERLPVQRDAVFSAQGMQIANRERRSYITRRTTRLSAMLLDLGNGRVVWTRHYQVVPENQSSSNHHVGESLGASIAAAVTNKLVQSGGENHYPDPPSLQSSVMALLQEVAYNVPAGGKSD